jgi:hypothetical protein
LHDDNQRECAEREKRQNGLPALPEFFWSFFRSVTGQSKRDETKRDTLLLKRGMTRHEGHKEGRNRSRIDSVLPDVMTNVDQ